MPTEFWYPISAATHNLPSDLFTNVGGANKNASTQIGGGRPGPATHDDDTSYISRLSNGASLGQALNPSWPGPIASFSAFTAGHRTRSGNATVTSRESRFQNAAAAVGGFFAATNDGTQAYSTTALADVSNGALFRPGGGSWVVADFLDDQTIFPVGWSTAADGGTGFWTSIFGQLTYSPPAGGFIFLLGLAGLLAAPIAGVMDAAHFARFLSWRRRVHPRHTILTGDEVARAWQELRAYHHPRFFLPAVA